MSPSSSQKKSFVSDVSENEISKLFADDILVENYEKGETVVVEDESPFAHLDVDLSSVTVMRVKHGSKIRNLMGFAMTKMKENDTRQIIFVGSGKAVSKTITCAEIMKRRVKNVHQITKIYYKKIEDYWEPKEEEELDRLIVKRNIPAVAILLSKDPLDVNEPGYQAPGSCDAFSNSSLQEKRKHSGNAKRQRPNKNFRGGKNSGGDNRTSSGDRQTGRRDKQKGKMFQKGEANRGKLSDRTKHSGGKIDQRDNSSESKKKEETREKLIVTPNQMER